MSILINTNTRVLVQGITGREGQFHTRQMLDYGTHVVGGTAPGNGGTWLDSVPVFDSVREAMVATAANASVVFVPAQFAPDAILESIHAGLPLIVCITEGIPVIDTLRIVAHLEHAQTRLIGPNCPGLATPHESKIGIIPGHVLRPGPIGVVSRSGTLTYKVVHELTLRDLGQSTIVGLGGDPIIGTGFVDILRLFEDDPLTEQVVLIGEIGGLEEQEATAFIASKMSKPVTALIVGETAPPDKRMGHAGAIISGYSHTAQAIVAALQSVGVQIARHPAEVAQLVARLT